VAPDATRRQRRRLWLVLVLLEFLLFSGPFVLPMLHVAWCERHGLPAPARFPYVAWMLGAGVALLAAIVVLDLVRRLRRPTGRRP
jgi:lipid-A-disaccharide synthase-like uncharacterized protein